MNTKRTTIHDIARELNTTASTVSRALKDHPSIGRAMTELVKQTAERMDYRQNKVAASLRSGKTHILGVIIPSAEINFFGAVVHGIERVVRQKGYNVLLFQSSESAEYEKEGVDTLLQLRADGIIASIAKETTSLQHFQLIKDRNVPLILFDRANDELEVPSVVVDDYKGACLATEHLIEQGYRRIAHISGPQHIRIFNDRLRGYADTLRAHQLPVDDDLIIYGKVSIESGRQAAYSLLNSAKVPDAIFAVEDFTALGAMQAVKEAGKQTGEIGIIGFANEAFSAYISPALSTVDQQTARMGEEAAKLFLKAAENRDKPLQNKKIVLEPTLIIRDSSIRKL